ncbi:MAG: Omp28 family outer membrane lipoprotein [Sphingobacteriaceae bacterium]|nr:Omp28 family outer membrane lipoprotein [Sphingobacteriaceae bacterium]
MKNSNLTVLFFLIIGLYSCDKVSNPIQNATTTPVVNTNTQVRKVLLEDYTGHKCGNCPAAAIVAENLYNQYQGKVIPIAVHAGFFAKTSVSHPTSYTTTAGNEWDANTGFGIGTAGNPNGMVNRKNFPDHGLIQKEDKWPTTVSLALNDTYYLGLDLKTNYNEGTRVLNTEVKAKFAATYTNNVKLQVIITEDSVIGPQTDYSKNPDLIPNYVFMHMLRGDLNGPWGQALQSAPIASNDSVTVNITPYNLPAGFKDKHITVIAFAYDETTKEVLQVEKKKIK